MGKRDIKLINVRFTDAQREWLGEESDRLDRPVSWVVRRFVEEAMKDKAVARQILEAPRS